MRQAPLSPVFRLKSIILYAEASSIPRPKKHEISNQCSFNAGPSSTTMAQHYNNIGLMFAREYVTLPACVPFTGGGGVPLITPSRLAVTVDALTHIYIYILLRVQGRVSFVVIEHRRET